MHLLISIWYNSFWFCLQWSWWIGVASHAGVRQRRFVACAIHGRRLFLSNVHRSRQHCNGTKVKRTRDWLFFSFYFFFFSGWFRLSSSCWKTMNQKCAQWLLPKSLAFVNWLPKMVNSATMMFWRQNCFCCSCDCETVAVHQSAGDWYVTTCACGVGKCHHANRTVLWQESTRFFVFVVFFFFFFSLLCRPPPIICWNCICNCCKTNSAMFVWTSFRKSTLSTKSLALKYNICLPQRPFDFFFLRVCVCVYSCWANRCCRRLWRWPKTSRGAFVWRSSTTCRCWPSSWAWPFSTSSWAICAWRGWAIRCGPFARYRRHATKSARKKFFSIFFFVFRRRRRISSIWQRSLEKSGPVPTWYRK